MKQFNSNNFDESIKNDLVLIDFFAEWCGPCKMMKPILEELSSEMSNVTIATLDIDKSPDVAERYNVMSVPTLILFNKGKKVDSLVGLRDKESLKEFINSHL